MFNLRRTSLLPFLTVTFIIFLLLPTVAAKASNSFIDESELNRGVVNINYIPQTNARIKVMIGKEKVNYNYDLRGDSVNRFPLQFGNGEYTISLYENIEGNRYRLLKAEKINLNLIEKNQVYLQSIQIINWDEGMNAVKKAKELTKDAVNDKEKVEILYNYIINNVSYDYDKASKLTLGYLPSVDDTMSSNQGMCYDYAALFAAMLRSVNVPTKLIMGYKDDIDLYHAWNQVYLKDINKWVTIDTTYDAIKHQNKYKVIMIKDENEYSIEKYY